MCTWIPGCVGFLLSVFPDISRYSYTCMHLCMHARICVCMCTCELCSSPQRRCGWVYRCLLFSLYNCKYSSGRYTTHYLPFMGWQVLVKITIFRMDRLESPSLPSKISRFTKIIPHICVYIYIYME